MRRPRVISLFSGAGGIDYGFEAAGCQTSVAVERDRDCCVTLRQNRKWTVIDRDIFEVSTEDLLAAGKLKRGEADILIGGPPCQPFSKAGYWARGDAGRLSDPRSDTLAAYMRVVEEALPRAFMLENVGGLSYSGKNEGLDLLLARVEQINKKHRVQYKPVYRVVKAVEYGVPQLRERFIMIAARDGDVFKFPAATHGNTANVKGQLSLIGALEPYRTAWDAIGDVKLDPHEELAVRGKWATLLPSIPEGQNYLFHTDRGEGLPLFGWRRRFWSFLLKLAKNMPSWTVQAQPGPAIGPFHWTNRRLSMRELCRIQTFPDDVIITGGRTSIQRQVGNAVPALLAEVLARAIRAQLLGQRVDQQPRLLPARRTPVPRAERLKPVPKIFLDLQGEHVAHPGTGKGYRAEAWSQSAE
ncbi:MAG TPA: DNA cytosine methyltransferase [Polyangiales bacterium]